MSESGEMKSSPPKELSRLTESDEMKDGRKNLLPTQYECPSHCSLYYFYGKCQHKCVPVKPRRDTISKGNIGYMKQKRDYVIEETVSSEAEYVDRLNILWTCYALPLKQKNIVTAEDLNTLFHQWEAILSTHQAFYAI